jgi:DNA-binding beta-propeller fold protein YncE
MKMRNKKFTSLLTLAIAGWFLWGCGPKPELIEDLVWPAPPEQPRIQFVRSIAGKSDLKQGKFKRLKDALAGEDEGDKIIKPYGVAVDSRNRIFVSDAGNRCVLVFNETPEKGEDVFALLGQGGNGTLLEPAGITLDDEGNIYVSDVKQNTVYSYGPDLKFRQAYGPQGTFTRPAGLAFNSITRELIVLDAKAHDVKFFNLEGNLLRTLGEQGIEPGQFNIPSNVACDKTGKIYIVDSMNFRVQIFNPEGEFLSTFGQADNVPGSFTRPKGIALDSDGHIYVADAAFDNIQIFQPNGTLLLYFGSAGRGSGQFQLPAGMYFDAQDRLYVIDQYNHRVQIFQYLKSED